MQIYLEAHVFDSDLILLDKFSHSAIALTGGTREMHKQTDASTMTIRVQCAAVPVTGRGAPKTNHKEGVPMRQKNGTPQPESHPTKIRSDCGAIPNGLASSPPPWRMPIGTRSSGHAGALARYGYG